MTYFISIATAVISPPNITEAIEIPSHWHVLQQLHAGSRCPRACPGARSPRGSDGPMGCELGSGSCSILLIHLCMSGFPTEVGKNHWHYFCCFLNIKLQHKSNHKT